MNNKITKNEKGVTLVALVITVIVSLMLAGIVVIEALNEESGILTKTDKVLDEKTKAVNNIESIQQNVLDDIYNKNH